MRGVGKVEPLDLAAVALRDEVVLAQHS
jgi:hypothetical protein